MSPFTSLSRTLAQEASLVGVILIPYFLSMPSTEAMTTEAQSVSGMKPTFTSSFSGLSEPAAHAPRVDKAPNAPAAPATAPAFNTLRRVTADLSALAVMSSLRWKRAMPPGLRAHGVRFPALVVRHHWHGFPSAI